MATNGRARHDYDVLDTVEAGIALQGSEVKSLRTASVQLKDSYAYVNRGEIWLKGVHIAPYGHAHGVDGRLAGGVAAEDGGQADPDGHREDLPVVD